MTSLSIYCAGSVASLRGCPGLKAGHQGAHPQDQAVPVHHRRQRPNRPAAWLRRPLLRHPAAAAAAAGCCDRPAVGRQGGDGKYENLQNV